VLAFLQNPIVLAVIAAVVFWLRSSSSNPIQEKLIDAWRVLTNTPASNKEAAVIDHKHMDSLVGRITCAQCLAEEFRKRGKGDVAKAITEAIGELAKEGTVS
jgi:hypothetical protein